MPQPFPHNLTFNARPIETAYLNMRIDGIYPYFDAETDPTYYQESMAFKY